MNSQLNKAREVINPTPEQQEIGLKWIDKIRGQIDFAKKPQNQFQKEYLRRKRIWRERLRESSNQLDNRIVSKSEELH